MRSLSYVFYYERPHTQARMRIIKWESSAYLVGTKTLEK